MKVRAAAFALACWIATPASGATAQLEQYVAAVATSVAPPAQDALNHIDGVARQLLAVRAYLRAGEALTSRWSWSAQRIAQHAASAEYRALLTEIETVKARFAAQNPGYQLHANTEVRSVETQIQRWNENASVRATARELQRAARAELGSAQYPARPDAEAVARFAQFLRAWRPGSPASLAAPGLSLHGQLRAIDFHVMQGTRMVASTQMSVVRSVWERQGWARKLKNAMTGSRFSGPLQSPNEPWHYEYLPP